MVVLPFESLRPTLLGQPGTHLLECGNPGPGEVPAGRLWLAATLAPRAKWVRVEINARQYPGNTNHALLSQAGLD